MADFQHMTAYFNHNFKNGYNKIDVAKVEPDFAKHCSDINVLKINYSEFASYIMNKFPIQKLFGGCVYFDLTTGRLCKDSRIRGYSSKYVGGIWNVTDYDKIPNVITQLEKICAYADFANAGGVVIINNKCYYNGDQILNLFCSIQ